MSAGPSVSILPGHVVDQLRDLPNGSVHCVVTSPPYWGLRDYSKCECVTVHLASESLRSQGGNVTLGNAGPSSPDPRTEREPDPNCRKCHGTGRDDSLTVVWDAKEGCEHEWSTDRWYTNAGSSTGVDGAAFSEPGEANAQRIKEGRWRKASTCSKCGAWRGQLGLEPTPDLYVQHIVQVFREVRRILRDDGTLWLNMGDCYSGGGRGTGGDGPKSPKQTTNLSAYFNGNTTFDSGLKPKDLVGMPWRVAFAFQADGWFLRSDIIWAKLNPMPESVTDRPTKAHEYVFLLTKSARYFYDADAVREPQAESTTAREQYHYPNPIDNPEYDSKHAQGDSRRFPIQGRRHTPKGAQRELDQLRTPERMGHGPGWRNEEDSILGRNLRTVWTIATQPYPEAHFATFPEALIEPCIKAGTSEKGCCVKCGAPWERIVEKKASTMNIRVRDAKKGILDVKSGFTGSGRGTGSEEETASYGDEEVGYTRTIGFRSTCNHTGEPIPCIVLDPFAGSGTVGAVARGLGRSAVLIEIKQQYVDLIKDRVDFAHKSLDSFDLGGDRT